MTVHPPLALSVGDVLRLRRAHPCGSDAWRVERVGADIGLGCLGCGRRVLLERAHVERRLIELLPAAEPADGPGPRPAGGAGSA